VFVEHHAIGLPCIEADPGSIEATVAGTADVDVVRDQVERALSIWIDGRLRWSWDDYHPDRRERARPGISHQEDGRRRRSRQGGSTARRRSMCLMDASTGVPW
jgi:hypothetical protein